MNGLKKLLVTNDSIASTILRITLGGVILPHGLQKTFGWFGGYGFRGTMGFFTDTLGIPWLVALLVIAAESIGALFLILGFATRLCSAAMIVVMLGAVFMAHLDYGFFMNWFGAQKGEGFEYHLLVIGMALTLTITGAGRFSVDRAVTTK
ncbi:MAG: DoxX family protein [Pseudomonadota bacterium]|jgi:putative oxidoreductase